MEATTILALVKEINSASKGLNIEANKNLNTDIEKWFHSCVNKETLIEKLTIELDRLKKISDENGNTKQKGKLCTTQL